MNLSLKNLLVSLVQGIKSEENKFCEENIDKMEACFAAFDKDE